MDLMGVENREEIITNLREMDVMFDEKMITERIG